MEQAASIQLTKLQALGLQALIKAANDAQAEVGQAMRDCGAQEDETYNMTNDYQLVPVPKDTAPTNGREKVKV